MPSRLASWALAAFTALQLMSTTAAQASSSSITSTSTGTSTAAAPTLTSPVDPSQKQSVFVSPDQELAFGITIPDDPASEDIYFTLAGQPALGWTAVGLGADSMAGNALVLMVYASSSNKNVTFSPRLTSHGRSEPAPYPDLRFEILPGTGYYNGTLMFRARCFNCRRWPGGSIDVNSAAQRCIWAAGPSYEVKSDDVAAPLKFHRSYGSFSVNLKAAQGPGQAPTLNFQTAKKSEGAALTGEPRSGKRDWSALFHGIIMIFCFVGLLPFGLIVLRVGNWPRWHAVNQSIALAGIITGFGLGVHISFKYNRSRNFNNPHQVIGILIFIFMFAQFVLGYLHHRMYKQNEGKGSPLAPFHIWLGRTVMIMGVINGFLGFPFALSHRYNYILLGLVLAIAPLVIFLLLYKPLIRPRLWGRKEEQPTEEALPPYTAEPWRQQAPATGHTATVATAQAPETRGIGLSDMGAWASRGARDRTVQPAGGNWGQPQNPREMI
ncbi:hypothetical protein MCOR27_001031 [Pyricularia oryzae]|uniref:DOMON domain-containing protein n=4 Tax=Pyricularia TaxID=48558 RepID=A0ABQ8NWX5_PYRGI|nr:uncharacterized protein MGG_08120 [Pyricularia oryzae 70-15]KAH8839481.1 hypothetical protein MCOR01_008680 [Pyricularia oryzae]KAI6303062.1 hypothetical protein MCOR33_001661 [Pyricularia grisea]EHA55273.1 integral membrane protein [Pyricularia oryzae 70-15]KAI6256876.1 hypothetical protein MCOR19_006695 [Pyricularia oryzae]KAI6273946.1 hypothetical protein MCOR26_006696 [Pyricularia oryzae]